MSSLRYIVILQPDIQFLRGSKERHFILQNTLMQTHVLEIVKTRRIFFLNFAISPYRVTKVNNISQNMDDQSFHFNNVISIKMIFIFFNS